MNVPLVVRAHLPTPDAVIVRHDTGHVTIVADVSIPEQRVVELAVEAANGDLPEPDHALGREVPGND